MTARDAVLVCLGRAHSLAVESHQLVAALEAEKCADAIASAAGLDIAAVRRDYDASQEISV